MTEEEIAAAAHDMAHRYQWGAITEIVSLKGGGNNRVFLLKGAEPRVLKLYFQHPNDLRPRLQAEFGFSRFAWDHGIRSLPEAFASDAERNVGIYGFIEGRRLNTDEVDLGRVLEAVTFFQELNRFKGDGALLPSASEACFSIAQHISCVQRRVSRLRGLAGGSDEDKTAVEFLAENLFPSWDEIARKVTEQAGSKEVTSEVPLSQRCLSPSDFGFHNAILARDGRLRFIDFEYAGWDDPAKLVCDFFFQPALPVPRQYFGRFVESIVAGFPDSARILRRIDLLMPVYAIKWCCVLLNEFLPEGNARRRFAGAELDRRELKARQLQKARKALEQVAASAAQTC